jgi:UDP-glucose 4-epimerase
VKADLRDRAALQGLFRQHRFDTAIHFAGLKAVGESTQKPLEYYDNNIAGTLILLECMRDAGVKKLVFSSSATVYGDPASVPIREDFPLSATNPYGRSKLMIEEMLRDLSKSDAAWRIALLRYFNPAGAHDSGMLGEASRGRPANLVPLLCRIAAGELADLSIYGGDWPTRDGTCIRDYLHVQDLAEGHVAALRYLSKAHGALTVNLGGGRGHSVLEVVAAFEKACGRKLTTQIAARRAGDVAAYYADPARAAKTLDWRAVRDLDTICADAWRWQKNGGRY